MSANFPRVLIVDDDPIVADSLCNLLEREGYITAVACDGNEAIEMLDIANHENSTQDRSFGMVISDINMPRCDGIELIKTLRKKHPSVAMVIVTGFGKIETAVEAIRLGAVDYLTKPVVEDELKIAVNKALQQHALLAENQTLKHQLAERYGMDNIVGHDYRMQRIYDLIEAVSPSKTTVLIDGESGTGKSLIARAIHTRSDRRTGPFVTFACGSIPETLLESELFGHVKGTFTGADHDKQGKILAADGGTLFIDEINSATPALQLKLLRVLQEKQFEPLGSNKTVNVNVRFILATNQNLKKLVKEGTFREDLYYRINIVNLNLPALRDRPSDTLVLAEHFLDKHCRELNKTITGFSEDAIVALRRYLWPGNVRELENAIERATVLTRQTKITESDLPDAVRMLDARNPSYPRDTDAETSVSQTQGSLHIPALDGGWTPTSLTNALREPERQILFAALKHNDWNRQETAKQLDINRTTLYKKIKLYDLEQLA